MKSFRYFVVTDEGDTGKLARWYLLRMIRILPVRLLPVEGGQLAGLWEPFAKLLGGPLDAPFVNVVCTTPGWWIREQRLPMPNKDKSVTMAVGDVELYTPKVRNVLFACDMPKTDNQLASALKYEAIVVPNQRFATAWHLCGREAVVIGPAPQPSPALNVAHERAAADKLREILLPTQPPPGVV